MTSVGIILEDFLFFLKGSKSMPMGKLHPEGSGCRLKAASVCISRLAFKL